MRKALAFSLLTIFLGGCASGPAHRDISGVWINQAAINEAAKGGNLREALLANGPNLEWQIDAKHAKANYTNGFEWVEGKLMPENDGVWQVNIYGSVATDLSLNGDELVQAAGESDPQQSFVRSPINLTSYALCLAGDCASMSGEYDSLWLEQDESGAAHIFVRNGRQLEIFQALDSAKPDEMPQLYPGKREWLLEKQP